MINGIRLKVCGITSVGDADAAAAAGADYLGFIFYPRSVRNVPLPQMLAMQDRLPPLEKVAVSVDPTLAELAQQAALGFDYFQVHFNPQTPLDTIRGWVDAVRRERIWLAPRLPTGFDIYPETLPLADTFMLDTFHPDKMGGTGLTGDWVKFKQHREAHPEKEWILCGGLNHANVADAVAATGACWLDVNSGVEQAPGIKSPAKLHAFALSLRNATKPENPG
jgi:phosphoribosylanthranilate isomerase